MSVGTGRGVRGETGRRPLSLSVLGAAALRMLAAASIAASPAPAGRVEAASLKDPDSGREHRLWIYTPPGYAAGAAADYRLMIVFDGEQYLEEIPLPKILDALLAEGKAPPFVAVLVDNGSGAERLAELANQPRYAAFVSGPLLEYVRSGWKVARDPRRTVLVGSSAGGLAAAYIAFERPDLFGNVLSQSGAFWRGAEGSNEPPWEWLTARYAGAPRKPIRLVLDVGSQETRGTLGGTAPSILSANRRLRDVLSKKGYDVAYTEVPGGVHSPESWRGRLPGAVVALGLPAGK